MNPAELFALEENPVVLAKGQTLFRAGDTGDAMYVVLEGTLDVLLGDKVVEHSQRGAILGEMALVDNSPRGATVVAAEDCKLAKVDQLRFHRLIKINPFFASHVMKELVERIRAMDRLLAGHN
jgi:CRP/FNR family cyclic AMP-dependent transcriptional regulator